MKQSKIGIVTFFPNNNYGCLLQAYSLNKFLSDLTNKECETIFFEPSWKYLCSKILPIRFILGSLRFFKRHLKLKRVIPFCKTLCSKKMYSMDTIKKENYHILIAGSDQIWHSKSFITNNGGTDYYFLNFGSNIKKRIAYGPSLSIKQWPKDFEQRVLPMLQRFDAIS